MSDHITEEEQIEAIKRWFSENWISIVLPIALVLAGYVSWSFWGDYKTTRANEGSEQYQALVDILDDSSGEPISEKSKEQARVLAAALLSGFGGTLYADLTNFMVAKLDVEAGDLDAAKTRLQDVVDKHANTASLDLAKARLAKVELALGNHDQALTLVSASDSDASKALYAEIRGDIYSAQGDIDAANTAYKDALINLNEQQQGRRGLLQLKIDSTSRPIEAEVLSAEMVGPGSDYVAEDAEAPVAESVE